MPNKKLLVAVDKKIAHLDFFFQKIASLVEVIYFTDVKTMPKKPYDGIFVSSSTKVKQSDFSFSSFKFIASPTTGLDHIANFFLTNKGITLTSAKGINRHAVNDYILAVIFIYAFEKKIPIHQIILGIIGFGAIGSSLNQRVSELGITTIVYDPFIPAYNHSKNLQAMKKANIITFHVPLTKKNKHATYQMIDENYFKKILPASKNRPTLLINTSRGGIFQIKDLKKKIKKREIIYAFDVWPNEPYLDNFLLKNAWLATPHIAGYSTKSKWESSQKVFFDFMDCFKIPYSKKTDDKKKQKILSKKIIKTSIISFKNLEAMIAIMKMILEEILELNKATFSLKKSITFSKEEKKKVFFSLRKKYLNKKEFSQVFVESKKKNIPLIDWLKQFSQLFKL